MKPKALVIDDNPEVIEMVSQILCSLKHKFDSACCVNEARELLAKGTYDYYLVDL